MKLLFDTHTLFWWLKNDGSLSAAAKAAIGTDDAIVHVSAVTALEIASEVRIGKWPEAADIAHTLEAVILREGFIDLPVMIAHATSAGFIESPHRDPFDRLLAAQSIAEDMIIVTKDAALTSLGARSLW